MGVHQASVASTTIQNAAIVTTAETVVLTSPPINLPLDNALVLVQWYVNVNTGLGVTGITVRLRRGTTVSGATVNIPNGFGASASNTIATSGVYTDTPGIVAGQQYSVTLTMAGATGNSTVIDCSIIVLAP